jgi:hypothetical protein
MTIKCGSCGGKRLVHTTGATYRCDECGTLCTVAVRGAEVVSAGPSRPKLPRDPGAVWKSFHVRLLEEQQPTVQRAMVAAKILAGESGRSWKGTALERVAADFLSGCPHNVLTQADAELASAD